METRGLVVKSWLTKEFLIGIKSNAVPKVQGIEGGNSESGAEVKKTLTKIRIMPR